MHLLCSLDSHAGQLGRPKWYLPSNAFALKKPPVPQSKSARAVNDKIRVGNAKQIGESSLFLEGGSCKTGGTESRNVAAQKQSSKISSLEQQSANSCFFTSLEDVQSPIDRDKSINLLSQLHHQLAQVEYSVFGQLQLMAPLPILAPPKPHAALNNQYVRPNNAVDTSLASAKYVESITSDSESAPLPQQPGLNLIRLQGCERDAMPHIMQRQSPGIFSNESPIKYQGSEMDPMQAFLQSNMIFAQQSDNRLQNTFHLDSKSISPQHFPFTNQRQTSLGKVFVPQQERGRTSQLLGSQSSLSEPSQQILTVRQSELPQIDKDLLKCQSSLGGDRVTWNDNKMKHPLNTQRYQKSAQLPLQQSAKGSHKRTISTKPPKIDPEMELNLVLEPESASFYSEKQLSPQSKTKSGREMSSSKKEYDQLAETNMKEMLQAIMMVQSSSSPNHLGISQGNLFSNGNIFESQDHGTRNLAPFSIGSQRGNSRQDPFQQARRLEDSLKDFMKLEIKALEESGDTLTAMVNEQRIRETTGKGTSQKSNIDIKQQLLELNPDETEEYCMNREFERPRESPQRRNGQLTLLNSGVQRSGGKFTSYIKLQEVGPDGYIPQYSATDYITNYPYAGMEMRGRSTDSFHSMQNQFFTGFNDANSQLQQTQNFRTLIYDPSQPQVRDYRAPSSDQITVFDINTQNYDANSSLLASDNLHYYPTPRGAANPQNNGAFVSLNAYENSAINYVPINDDLLNDDNDYSSQSLSSRLHTIQELQNQEESSKSPSSNSIIVTNRQHYFKAQTQVQQQIENSIMQQERKQNERLLFQRQGTEQFVNDKGLEPIFIGLEPSSSLSTKKRSSKGKSSPPQRLSSNKSSSINKKIQLGSPQEKSDHNTGSYQQFPSGGQNPHGSAVTFQPQLSLIEQQQQLHGSFKPNQTWGIEDSPSAGNQKQSPVLSLNSSHKKLSRSYRQADKSLSYAKRSQEKKGSIIEDYNMRGTGPVDESSNQSSQVIVNLNINLQQFVQDNELGTNFKLLSGVRNSPHKISLDLGGISERQRHAFQLQQQSENSSSIAMVDGGGPFSFKNMLNSGDNLLGGGSPSAMAEAYLGDSHPFDMKKSLLNFGNGSDEKQPPYLDGLAFSFKRQQVLEREKSPPQLSGANRTGSKSPGSKQKNSPQIPSQSGERVKVLASTPQQKLRSGSKTQRITPSAKKLEEKDNDVKLKTQKATKTTRFTSSPKGEEIKLKKIVKEQPSKSKEKKITGKSKERPWPKPTSALTPFTIDVSQRLVTPRQKAGFGSAVISPRFQKPNIDLQELQNFRQNQAIISDQRVKVNNYNLKRVKNTANADKQATKESSELTLSTYRERIPSPNKKSLTGLTSRELEKRQKQLEKQVIVLPQQTSNIKTNGALTQRPSTAILLSQRDLNHHVPSPRLTTNTSHSNSSARRQEATSHPLQKREPAVVVLASQHLQLKRETEKMHNMLKPIQKAAHETKTRQVTSSKSTAVISLGMRASRRREEVIVVSGGDKGAAIGTITTNEDQKSHSTLHVNDD